MLHLHGTHASADKIVRPGEAQASNLATQRKEQLPMSEFVFLHRGSRAQTKSPEQMQKSMQKWVAWFKDLGEKGVIKNPGNPLDRTGKWCAVITNGPFAEAKDLVNGYTLIEASTLDQAVELSKGCPIFEDDGAVEVRPIAKL
jgi:hypothetical protein